MNIWSCKVGETDWGEVPEWADGPMRSAVRLAYESLTGDEPDFIFSGWGAHLSEIERAVVDDREPDSQVDVAALESTRADVWAREFLKVVPGADEGLMLTWFANAIERGRSAGQAEASSVIGVQ